MNNFQARPVAFNQVIMVVSLSVLDCVCRIYVSVCIILLRPDSYVLFSYKTLPMFATEIVV